MAFSQLNLTLENIVLPIIKSSFNGINLENLVHEKLLLAIRSYSCILSDYQNEERPPFPTDDVIQSSLDPMEFCNTETQDIFEKSASNAAVHTEVSAIFTKLLFLLDSQCSSKVLENSTSGAVGAGTPNTPISPTSTLTPTLPLKQLSFYFHNEDNTYKLLEVFGTIISSVTWFAKSTSSPSGGSGSGTVKGPSAYNKIVELLVKNCVHEDENISSFCIDNLKILVTKNNPNVIMTSFVRIAFFLNEKANGALNHEYLSSNEYIKLLEIYVELLQSWLDSLTETSKASVETPNEMYNVNHEFVQKEIHESKTFEELDLKSMANMIDEVEGNGLFFLFSHDFRVRFLGSQILRIVAQFDEVIYYLTTDSDGGSTFTSSQSRMPNELMLTSTNGTTGANGSSASGGSGNDSEFRKSHNRMPSKFVADVGTRIIQVLESLDFFAFVGSKKAVLSEAESKRLARLQHKQRKDTVIRLAESNHGVDAALWFKIFEEVLEKLVAQCPMAIAVARSHSCIRLVQLYNQVVALSSSGTSSGGTGNSLIWDYMLFLKVSCASLTSTSQQRVHIPTIQSNTLSPSTVYSPLSKTHGRKKSQQLFTVQHQKITSAMSIFKMVVPLLTTANGKLKDALVEGLSCLNINIFESFLESVEPMMDKWKFEILQD
ncbi:unnamed protein product [Ambrosiozyma monospora]|uniref:Unnamed protein product n=1 Tax=Ambrosiozyma monospora TaxID=43982 RepID=A0A9W6Z7L0_AMBMO|nr:unnamed protein product [Ambrosiozyma monospora]